jgi:hypothetical protein
VVFGEKKMLNVVYELTDVSVVFGDVEEISLPYLGEKHFLYGYGGDELEREITEKWLNLRHLSYIKREVA